MWQNKIVCARLHMSAFTHPSSVAVQSITTALSPVVAGVTEHRVVDWCEWAKHYPFELDRNRRLLIHDKRLKYPSKVTHLDRQSMMPLPVHRLGVGVLVCVLLFVATRRGECVQVDGSFRKGRSVGQFLYIKMWIFLSVEIRRSVKLRWFCEQPIVHVLHAFNV